MRVPVVLLISSLAVAAFSFLRFGPGLSDLLLLSLISALAAAMLLLRAPRRDAKIVVLDGSNILYWGEGTPSLTTVRTVIRQLRKQGWEPIIWFDANVGYKVGDGYLGPAALASQLGCRAQQVRVAPKGQPADPLLLQEAVDLEARVVSNDRFRDWAETFPQLRGGDLLLRSTVVGM
ncbi:NYN domain-containing protein [Marinovum sp.]|uniref:NYN domain-containing protein n=1 Tax=Marinovum sp. TaxID=2024839 RepID=UPI003A9555D0